METVILIIILALVLIIIFKKLWQLVRIIQGKETENACQCDSGSCSCPSREGCGVRHDSGHEPHSFGIDLDTVLQSEGSKDPMDNQGSNSKNGGD